MHQKDGIKPDSSEGKEFLFRARAFGANAVNPPRIDHDHLSWRDRFEPDLDSWL